MTRRPPDSRVSAGQQIEDQMDAIADAMRRDTGLWIEKRMRAHPGNQRVLGAVIGGIAGGLLDELHKSSRGDPAQIRESWMLFVDSYLEAGAEDAEADAEPGPEAQP